MKLVDHINDQINTRLAAAGYPATAATWRRFSSRNGNGVPIYNPTRWTADLDITGVAYGETVDGSFYCVTAMAPRVVASAGHIGTLVGYFVFFLAADGTPVSRRIVQVLRLSDNGTAGDFSLLVLDSALPSSIKPLAVLPTTFPMSATYLNMRCFHFSKYTAEISSYNSADETGNRTSEIVILGPGAAGFSAGSSGLAYNAVTAENAAAYTMPIVHGDSGGCIAVIIKNQLVFLAPVASFSSSTPMTYARGWVNQRLAALVGTTPDGSTAITEADVAVSDIDLTGLDLTSDILGDNTMPTRPATTMTATTSGAFSTIVWSPAGPPIDGDVLDTGAFTVTLVATTILPNNLTLAGTHWSVQGAGSAAYLAPPTTLTGKITVYYGAKLYTSEALTITSTGVVTVVGKLFNNGSARKINNAGTITLTDVDAVLDNSGGLINNSGNINNAGIIVNATSLGASGTINNSGLIRNSTSIPGRVINGSGTAGGTIVNTGVIQLNNIAFDGELGTVDNTGGSIEFMAGAVISGPLSSVKFGGNSYQYAASSGGGMGINNMVSSTA